MVRKRHEAGLELRITGLPHPARRRGLQRDEPQTQFNNRELWRFGAVCWAGPALHFIWEMLSRHLRSTPIKQMAKHLVLSNGAAFRSE